MGELTEQPQAAGVRALHPRATGGAEGLACLELPVQWKNKLLALPGGGLSECWLWVRIPALRLTDLYRSNPLFQRSQGWL